MKLHKLLIFVTFSRVLAACGGGGSSDCKAGLGAVLGCDKSTPAANTAPVAHAGVAQTVKLGATVTLDRSGSTDADGKLLTYAWQLAFQPVGSAVTLSSLTDPKPTFVPAVTGVYVFTLVVNDGLANSAQATVTVTVVP